MSTGMDDPTSGVVMAALEAARHAPSAHNNQPWRVEAVTSDGVTLRAELKLVTSGAPRLTFISLGAFIENFILASVHAGFEVESSHIQIAPALSDFAIRLRCHPGAGDGGDALAHAGIRLRRTDRFQYQAHLSRAIRDRLAETTCEVGVSLRFIEAAPERAVLAAVAAQGLRTALGIAHLRRELAQFVHFEHEQQDTGLLVEEMTLAKPTSATGREFVLNELDPEVEAGGVEERFATSPLQIIVSSDRDDVSSWIATGRTLTRFLNRAAALGFAHDIAAAATEVPTLLPAVRDLAKVDGRPQLLFRVGVPERNTTPLRTRRRPLASFIMA